MKDRLKERFGDLDIEKYDSLTEEERLKLKAKEEIMRNLNFDNFRFWTTEKQEEWMAAMSHIATDKR